MKGKILAINPGSTSTKVAMYKDGEPLWVESLSHAPEEIKKFNGPYEQVEWRKELVVEAAKKHGESLKDLVAVVGRGGPFYPVKSGAYEVNDAMLDVMRNRPMMGRHVSLIAMDIAKQIADPLGIKAYIYDAVSVDEMIPLVRISGWKDMPRRSLGHPLNMRAAAIKFCKQQGWKHNEKNLLVCHLGGGISVSMQEKGKLVDLMGDEEGGFCPERAGGLPMYKLVDYCYNSGKEFNHTMKRIMGGGGLMDHLGTQDAREVEKRIAEGDEYAKLVYEAMALNTAKSIGKLAVVVNGNIDAIILTGGVAYSKMFTAMITERVKFIAPVHVLPGENEMESLALGVYRVLDGEEQAHQFVEEPY